MNRVRDYQALEREYISGTMSLRQLCRTHGVTAHSAVMVQARQGGWAGKRQAYRARASTKYIELRADRAARREAEVCDSAIEAIDEAITRFRTPALACRRSPAPLCQPYVRHPGLRGLASHGWSPNTR
jgi:transposase-like protein